MLDSCVILDWQRGLMDLRYPSFARLSKEHLGKVTTNTTSSTCMKSCMLYIICFFCHYACRYLAPEYFQHGKLSDKTDVYAFGVVLLELVTGRKAIDRNRPPGDENLVLWVGTELIKKFPI